LRRQQQWQWRRQTRAATAGSGNGGGRQKQRQRLGQTTINQRAAAIVAAETARQQQWRQQRQQEWRCQQRLRWRQQWPRQWQMLQQKVPHRQKYWISAISGGKKAMIQSLCICRILFVAQIKVYAELLFVQQIEFYKHTNKNLIIL
jgi:hypothetical protein